MSSERRTPMKSVQTSSSGSFYKQMFHLVLPIVIQNLLSSAVSSTDIIMLSAVGQSSISAVSLASQYTNILFMIYYGLGTGATILCAQYYGKGDIRAIHIVEGIAYRFSLAISLSFSLFAVFAPQWMMRLFTNDPELILLGVSYLRIMSITYLCWGIIEIYLSILRSIGRVQTSMCLNMLAFFSNILLNAVFIYGLFGAPRLGAAGVAIGTALSRLLELSGCLAVSCFSKDIKISFRYLFRGHRQLSQDFLKISLPALGNDISWAVAFSMYSVIIGHLGTDAVAANSLVVIVRNFSTVLCFGLASGGGIFLGQIIGENQLEKAKTCASLLIRLTVLSGLFGGILVLGATPFVLKFATLSDTAMHYLKYMLLINSVYVMGAAVNTTLITGIFRAGGDSRFGFLCDTIDMWLYAVPLGFFAAFVLKLPVLAVYVLLCTDEFVKWPWVIRHYKKGAWLKNITRDDLT